MTVRLRLADITRDRLESRWEYAVQRPQLWKADLIQAAASRTRRTVEEVAEIWGVKL